MASKASFIIAVSGSETNYVVSRKTNGVVYTDSFVNLSKIDQIATLKFLNFKFTGKPPMHWSLSDLSTAFYSTVKSERFVPTSNGFTTTTPKENPMPKSEPTQQVGSLDALLSGIVNDALKAYVPDTVVDEAMVQQLVVDAMTPVIDHVQNLSGQIDKLRPQVTEIKLPTKEVKIMKGRQHFQFPKVLGALGQGIHMMLVGPAGTGKSTIAEKASEALGLEFSSKSCTSQTTEASLVGFMNATGHYVTTEFRKRFELGGVFLLDEVDNANPNVLGVLNSALANGFMAFPDGMVKRHDGFVAIAAGNTFGNGATAEYVGRNPIDGATKDRFMVYGVDYDLNIEEEMLASVGLPTAQAEAWLTAVRKCRENVQTYGLKVIVSPRATLGGAKLLKAGFSNTEVMEMAVLKGAKADQASKVLDGVKF